jgi:quercetin dioxygenase-like cupin family protein
MELDETDAFLEVVRLVQREMGITSFGAQVLDMPPDVVGHEHDESSTGQEDLYVGLSGSGWVEVDGTRAEIGPRVAIMVPPGTPRRMVAGPEGLSILCIGGRPGAPYEIVPPVA